MVYFKALIMYKKWIPAEKELYQVKTVGKLGNSTMYLCNSAGIINSIRLFSREISMTKLKKKQASTQQQEDEHKMFVKKIKMVARSLINTLGSIYVCTYLKKIWFSSGCLHRYIIRAQSFYTFMEICLQWRKQLLRSSHNNDNNTTYWW